MGKKGVSRPVSKSGSACVAYGGECVESWELLFRR